MPQGVEELQKTPAPTDELKPSLVFHRPERTPSFVDLGSRLANNDESRRGMVGPAPLSYLPQDPELPLHPQKKRPTYLSPVRADKSPASTSCTRAPRREHHLHELADDVRKKHHRGEGEDLFRLSVAAVAFASPPPLGSLTLDVLGLKSFRPPPTGESSDLHLLLMALRPSKAEETAVSAGSDRAAFSPPSPLSQL